MPDDLRLIFSKTFSESNRALCAAAGLPESGLQDMGATPAEAIPIDSIFSFELQNLIASGRNDVMALIGVTPTFALPAANCNEVHATYLVPGLGIIFCPVT